MYPRSGDLWTCGDMLQFKHDLQTSQYLAFSLIGLATILGLLIPGINVFVVQLLAGGAATLGIVGGSIWASNKGSAAMK